MNTAADNTDDYAYDTNGNMTMDLNKGIPSNGITYNHLNLPTEVAINSEDISYIYDATGVKLKKEVSTGTTTEYAGNYIYQDGTLQFFSTPEGYVTPDGQGGYDYVYQYKDHLGNIRLSYVDDGNDGLEIVEESNYYPFGLTHKGYNDNGISPLGNDVAQKYKTYQGQEFTDDFDLNFHEWKYRISDPSIGRFWQVDPLADKYVYNGVYNFAENRVIDGNELEGLEWQPVNTENGVTNISVKVAFSNDANLSEKQVAAYKAQIQTQYKATIESASTDGNQFTGELIFDENATIKLDVYVRDEDNLIAGLSMPGYASMAVGETDGTNTNLYSAEEAGLTGVHEVLHQGGVAHPTENNAAGDVKLDKVNTGPNNYMTTPKTDKSIGNNIMLYNLYNVNDKNIGDFRQQNNLKGSVMTPGQIKKVINNIKAGKVNGEAVE